MFSRRRFARTLAMLTSSAAILGSRGSAWSEGAAAPDVVFLLMADLHSGYAYTAALLAAVRKAVREHEGAAPVRIVINGDIFEGGNVLAHRSGGAIDFAFLDQLVRLAPVTVTIGNHDSDLFDPAEFVRQVERRGATVVSDIVDPRTGEVYGQPGQEFRVGKRLVRMAAMGTPNLGTYPEKFRALYAVPPPVEFAHQKLGALLEGADLRVALVHSRFTDDLAVLPCAGQPCLLYGGHEHLRFTHSAPGGLHLQSGAWSNAFAVVEVRFTEGGAQMRSRDVLLDRQSMPDAELAALIGREAAAWLKEEDLWPVGHLAEALNLEKAVGFAGEAIRAATGADGAFLGHTTFGDGLPAGPITPLDLAAFVRFDGGLSVATVDGETLAGAILPRTNQFADFPYEKRTGDFLHATPMNPKAGRQYRIVVNAYAVATPAAEKAYFGTTAIHFEAVPELKLKAIIASAIANSR